jgi:endonuclease YncB( thermonuclease family)
MASFKLRKRSEVTEAKFLRARDGDTIEVLLNCGYGVWLETAIRIVEIEAAELDSPQRQQALNDAAFINACLRDCTLTVHPAQGGRDKYGRLRARVYKGDADIGEWLIKSGRAWRVSPTYVHGPTQNNPACGILEARH